MCIKTCLTLNFSHNKFSETHTAVKMISNIKYSNEDLQEVVYKPTTEKLGRNLLTAENVEKKRDNLFLYFSSITVDLIMFAYGCCLVWTSPVLSRLKSNDTDVNPLSEPITNFQVSMIAGLPFLGSMFGPLILGKLCDIYGRKKTLIFFSVSALFLFVIVAFARNVYFYFLSRFLHGAFFGAALGVLFIFNTEITESHNRGKFGCIILMFIPFGNLYAFLIGPFLTIKVFTLLCALPLIISITCFTLFIPESPVYLYLKGDLAGVTHALQKFRNKVDVDRDIKEIDSILTERSKTTGQGWKVVIKSPIFRKAMFISLGLCLIQTFSGTTVVMAFAGPIFDSAGSGISGSTIAVIIGAVKVSTFTIISSVVEKSGRRILLIVSLVLSSLSLASIGLFFYLKHIQFFYIDKLYWLPIACVVSFIISYASGLGPIPLTVVSEVLPSDIKTGCISFVMFASALAAFIVTFSFPFLVEFFGIYGSFWLFSAVCLFGAIFTYFVVPETKGKSLLEIQKMLHDTTK